MAKRELSNYQQKLVKNYYENLDTIMLQKLGELVTELYLADSPKKAEKLWQRVEKAMKNLKIKPKIVEHIMNKKDVQVLARNLQEWQGKK
jgi:NADPH:quinone reductase-like Zn-dependent oxidoreductase